MPATARAQSPAPARTEIDALQGVWESVAGPKPARFLVAGRRFAFEFVGGDVYMGTLDVAGGHMDMHVEEGPADHAGRVSKCLYHLDGGVLRWCPGRPGSGKRPAAFPDVADARYLSLLFRRVGRPPRR